MELMRSLNYLMHSAVPEEKSKLAEKDGIQTSQGLKMVLHSNGFVVKPEMVRSPLYLIVCLI